MKRILLGFCLVTPMLFACGTRPTSNTGGRGGSGGSGTAGTGGSGTAGTAGTGQANPYCNVKAILNSKCTTCHSDPPRAGVPMSLTTFAAARQYAPRIAARVSAGTMPPAGATAIPPNERDALVAWANGGGQGSECSAPGGEGRCPQDPNRCVGPQHFDCTPSATFVAHAPGNMNAKYNVRAGLTDAYNCFRFRNPFYAGGRLAGQVVTREAPIVDNLATHHWLLFGSRSGIDGSVDESGVCVSPELTDTLLSGWAPGGTNSVFPNDVGLKMSDWPFLTLQIHYNNNALGARAEQDASGIAYCSAPAAGKQNIAGIVTLGQDIGISIPAGAVDHPGGRGTCTNLRRTGSGPATIIGSSPHMHKLGSGFTTEHFRGGQRVGFISNVPIKSWRFDGQVHYAHNELSPSGGGRKTFNAGEELRTTCYYTNPGIFSVGFGTGTTAEMCYDFLIAYPIDQLRRGCGPFITFNQ